jgi:excinuclease UvrABC nuclease subunit
MFKIPCSGIYMILHVPTQQYYVGKSTEIHMRWASHYSDLKMRKHSSPKLQILFDNSRIEDFTFQILQYYSITEFKKLYPKNTKLLFNRYLLTEEKRWMSLYSINLSLNKMNKYFS